MEKFKIIKKIPVEGRNLHLLNQSFDQRRNEDDFGKTCGRISSYHQHEQFKVTWPKYLLLPPVEIVIAITADETDYSSYEALHFMGENNGFGLTRDNLFMAWTLFYEDLKDFSSITTISNPKDLPMHLSYEDRRICPTLVISQNENHQTYVDYDWNWCGKNESYSKYCAFAFFQVKMSKFY